jgi:hypothetical protein
MSEKARIAKNKYARNWWRNRMMTMTPEELEAHRDRVNRNVREHRRRKREALGLPPVQPKQTPEERKAKGVAATKAWRARKKAEAGRD